MKLDPTQHNPAPDNLRAIIDRIGISHREAAEKIGVGGRTMRYWLSGDRTIPYTAQFCLEYLADSTEVSTVDS